MPDTSLINHRLITSNLPVIEYGRDVCGSDIALKKEWLITNGVGGYASATISGALSSRYHGLLIAALQPPLQRTVLLAKLDETLQIGGRSIPINTNIWQDGRIFPAGNYCLESFRVIGTTPVWNFRYENIELVKTVLMAPGENTVVVFYEYLNGPTPIRLSIQVLINNRSHHSVRQRPVSMFKSQLSDQKILIDDQQGIEFQLKVDNLDIQPINRWIKDFFYPVEAFRGLETLDDHYHLANFEGEIHPGSLISIIGATELSGENEPEEIFQARIKHEHQVINLGRKHFPLDKTPQQKVIHNPHEHLLLAADQFIVQRKTSNADEGLTVIAGYPWFSDWGRDTMISLSGLTLVPGRHTITKKILETFARYIDDGMLPNRFPMASAQPEYNTVDATLWFFQAIYDYYHSTLDKELIFGFFPLLEQIITWHIKGTRYHIKMDASDGLLYAGEPGIQLTWMDAKVGDWVVTPRIGKPIEINALWYNALSIMSEFAELIGTNQNIYDTYAKFTLGNFDKFWNYELGFCFDVIDGPQGPDQSLRPNQLLAISLPFSPLSPAQQKSVFDVVEKHLLTSYGLRSLSPLDPQYIGVYSGNQRQRDAAYHQGTVWAWLIGPFITACLKVYRDPDRALRYLTPIIRHLSDRALGTISEIFEGNPPHLPRGCIAQAWSVAEVLRAWDEISLYLPEADHEEQG